LGRLPNAEKRKDPKKGLCPMLRNERVKEATEAAAACDAH